MKGEPESTPGDASHEKLRAAQLNEEYEAMQGSLEGYLDERLEQISDGLEAPAAQGAPEGWFRRWRIDLYFGITLVVLVLIWLRLPAPSPVSPPAHLGPTKATPVAENEKETAAPVPGTSAQAGAATETAAAPIPDAPSPPFDLAAPDEAWNASLAKETERIASWLRALAAADGLATTQVSDRQKANFTAWSDQLSAGKEPLQDVTAIALRIGLFEYLYGRFVAGREYGTGWKRVDLSIEKGEYEAKALAALVEDLALTPWFSPPHDPEDRALQTAVVLRRIRTGSP